MPQESIYEIYFFHLISYPFDLIDQSEKSGAHVRKNIFMF